MPKILNVPSPCAVLAIGVPVKPMIVALGTARRGNVREAREVSRDRGSATGIAEQLRFDPRRGNQLRALADGFERFALHLEASNDGHRGQLMRLNSPA